MKTKRNVAKIPKSRETREQNLGAILDSPVNIFGNKNDAGEAKKCSMIFNTVAN